MAASTPDKDITVDLPVLGKEGDTCEQCGSALAVDQRYCLNCGCRRGETRVDYETRLNAGAAASNGATAPNGAVATAPPPSQQWTPAFAILAIGLLGVMLLLGVLIGKKGNDNTQTVAAQAAPTTTTAAAPTVTTATTASTKKAPRRAAAPERRPARARGGQAEPGPPMASRQPTPARVPSRTRRTGLTSSPPAATRHP